MIALIFTLLAAWAQFQRQTAKPVFHVPRHRPVAIALDGGVGGPCAAAGTSVHGKMLVFGGGCQRDTAPALSGAPAVHGPGPLDAIAQLVQLICHRTTALGAKAIDRFNIALSQSSRPPGALGKRAGGRTSVQCTGRVNQGGQVGAPARAPNLARVALAARCAEQWIERNIAWIGDLRYFISSPHTVPDVSPDPVWRLPLNLGAGLRIQLMVLCLAVIALPALGNEIVVQRGFYEDARGGLHVEQVRAQHFTQAGRVLNLGFTKSTLWYRLEFDVPIGVKRVALTTLPLTLDEVWLYTDEDDTPSARITDRIQWLNVRAGANTVYLKVRSRGTMVLWTTVQTEGQLKDAEARRGLSFGFLGGWMVLAVPLLMFMILARPSRLHWVVSVHLLVNLALLLNVLGFAQEYFGDRWALPTPELGRYLLHARFLLSIALIHALMATAGIPRWVDRAYWVALGIAVTMLMLMLFPVLDQQLLLIASSVLVGMVAAISIPLAFYCFFRRGRGGWIIMVLIALALANAVRQVLFLLSVTSSDNWEVDQMVFRVGGTAVVFIVMLWLQYQGQQRALQHAENQAHAMRQEAELEKQSKEAKDRLMVMLLHEIKNPLAVVQVAAASLSRSAQSTGPEARRLRNIQLAIDDMNAVIERCLQADRLEMTSLPVEVRRFTLAVLLEDLGEVLDLARVKTQLPADSEFSSDYQYLRMILLNLVGNALKYSLPGSEIELRPGREAGQRDRISFAVVNQVAPGGAPDLARLFTRYYRSEAARSHAGAGLGLWLARTLALRLGGTIDYRREGLTLIFEVNLEMA
jgi:signal transduction histidine kinase